MSAAEVNDASGGTESIVDARRPTGPMIHHLPFGRAPYEPVASKKLNAAAAEVAPLTFFRYFPTKEDVVLGHYEERMKLLKRSAGAVVAMRVSTETWVAEGGGSPLPARLDHALDLIERGLGR